MHCPCCHHLNPAGAPACGRCGAVLGLPPGADGGPPRVGQVMNGRYELCALIGSGTMGDVYSARDRVLGRAVALKILTPELWQSGRARERMAREAAALARIRHPNVVGIHDVFADGSALVLALELVTGGNLAERLRPGPMRFDRAIALLDAILAGLEAIHREGVVHRDLKPANVLLTDDGTPKIADLGVARDTSVQALTVSGVQLGTLDYMSPEQINGSQIGPTADLYACGVLIFEVIAGTLPFTGRTDLEVMAAHLGRPPNLAPLRGRAPAAVVQVVARALAKPPAERWQTASELREALAAGAHAALVGISGASSRPRSLPVGAERPSHAGAESASAPGLGKTLDDPAVRGAPGRPRSPASDGARPERKHRSRSRRRPPPEPIGPGTLVANALLRPAAPRSGWCFPVALLLAVGTLFVALSVTAALAYGVLKFGAPPTGH